MRVSTRSTVIILLIAMGMTTLSLSTTGPAVAQEEQRYLILASGLLPANLDALVASVGGQLLASFDAIGLAVAVSSEPMFQIAASTLPGVQAVVPDAVAAEDLPVGPENLATDSVADEGVVAEGAGIPAINPVQWNLNVIRVLGAWEQGFLGAGVKVAVVDSGIDAGHPGLAGQVLGGKAFVDEVHSVPVPMDAFIDRAAHGTHVAGIIAAKSVVPGVAPQAKLISVKVLKWNPLSRQAEGNESDVIAGILYAADAGADIINMSLGFTFVVNGVDSAQQLAALNRAVNYAFAKGTLVVASAGNGSSDLDRNRNAVKAPAQITHVVAVSATGPLTGPVFSAGPDTFAWYSDFGTSTVFVAAPGGNLQLDPNTGVRITPATDMVAAPCSRQAAAIPACRMPPAKALFMAGTSQAGAHVSGLAALIDGMFGGALTAAQLRAIIKQTADDLGKPGKDQFFGYGRINAYRAVTGK